MSGQAVALAFSVFLACAVEAVEALTIVLAMGTTRGWRSALSGTAVALAVLVAVTAVVGPGLTSLPIDTLRLVVGGLLLVFGLQWLRKAILRSVGVIALHDEEEAFRGEVAAARAAAGRPEGIDPYSFTITFKGVLLEGLEVVFIALTFGANQDRVGLAAAAAGAAIVVVTAAGITDSAGPVGAGAGERNEVRGRRDAHLVRALLGRRGGWGALARRRCGPACGHPDRASSSRFF